MIYRTKTEIHLSNRYGMSIAQYTDLLNSQHGRCAACRNIPSPGGRRNVNNKLFVDHDHATGDVRGLLCQKCNAAIGLTVNSPTILRALADYLEKSPAIVKTKLTHRGKHGAYQLTKKTCVNGHPFSQENTYVIPATGHRMCRVCRRQSDLRRRPSINQQKRDKRVLAKDVANGSARITEYT